MFCIIYDRENAVAYGAAHFGQGTGPIIYNDLVCTGNESDLSDCRQIALGHTDCSHSEDVGVSCSKSFWNVHGLQLCYLLQALIFSRTCFYILRGGGDLAFSAKLHLT